MFQGFYNLTSGILTQTRNQNVISNNMTNVSTPGYKSDKYMATTFREELMYRSGNIDKSNKTEIGTMAMVRASDETVTDFEPGAVEETNEILMWHCRIMDFSWCRRKMALVIPGTALSFLTTKVTWLCRLWAELWEETVRSVSVQIRLPLTVPDAYSVKTAGHNMDRLQLWTLITMIIWKKAGMVCSIPTSRLWLQMGRCFGNIWSGLT